MRFAEVSDVEARWRPLTDAEAAKCAALLDDASALIASLVDVESRDEGFRELARMAACSMVQRAMSTAAADGYGVTQQSMTAGPYTQSWSYGGQTGDLYLTKSERRMLGVKARGRSLHPSLRPMGGWFHDHRR